MRGMAYKVPEGEAALNLLRLLCGDKVVEKMQICQLCGGTGQIITSPPSVPVGNGLMQVNVVCVYAPCPACGGHEDAALLDIDPTGMARGQAQQEVIAELIGKEPANEPAC